MDHLKNFGTFKKISPKCKKGPLQPSMTKFFEYFEGLSKSPRAQAIPPISSTDGPLDYEMIVDELEYAAKKSKFGKASGYDDYCNEMIMALVETFPKVIQQHSNAFYNRVRQYQPDRCRT